MNLDMVLRVLRWLINTAVFVFGIIGVVLLIKRAAMFSKCAAQYRAFKCKPQRESVFGKVVFRKALKGSLLCRNLYEITVLYHVGEKEYHLTELSVGRAYPLDEFVEIEYDADYPEQARLKNGTDSPKYESCIGRAVAEIVLIAAALFICPIAINGIFVWIDFIIRFVYELTGGVPYNL